MSEKNFEMVADPFIWQIVGNIGNGASGLVLS